MKRLRELRIKKSKTQAQMGALLGISQQAYATYENGVANPPLDILNNLAEYFDVSVDYLLGRTNGVAPYNNINVYKLCRHQRNYSQLTIAKMLNIDRSTVSKWENGVAVPDQSILPKIADLYEVSVDYLLGRDSIPQIENAYVPDAIVPYPVIGKIKAGYDGAVEEYNTGEIITIPIEMLKGRPASDYFVLQVKGNSMYPKILEGDKVLILRTESVDSGSIAVVLYNSDEATIKKVEYTPSGNWIDLIPINPEYETKRISGNDLQFCHILGKAVKLIRDI